MRSLFTLVFTFAFLGAGCATTGLTGREFCAELRSNARIANTLAQMAIAGAAGSAAIAVPETPEEARKTATITAAALAAIGAGLTAYAVDARDEREEFCTPGHTKTSTLTED